MGMRLRMQEEKGSVTQIFGIILLERKLMGNLKLNVNTVLGITLVILNRAPAICVVI